MQYGIIIKVLFLSALLQLINSMNFAGKTPPNSYIVPVGVGDAVVATASWTSTATDLDLHIFQPGKVISDSTSDFCQCFCCSSTETASLTANSNGNIVIWAQQWGGAGVPYTISIKRNGVVIDGQSTFLSQNASFYQMPVAAVPCTMFVNFTSTGNFNLNLYAPGTLLTSSPIRSMSYAGNSGYYDFAIPVTTLGTYDLKVMANPANPAGGWSSFIYFSGSMQCNTCQNFISGCLTCTSSKVCTSCDIGFTLSAGNCLCSLTNCQTCITATTCKTCISGYYVNSSLQCQVCSIIPLCLTCTSSNFCTLCSGANFFNTTSGQCRPCNEAISGCIDCDTQNVCLQCTADKYFDGTNCVLCNTAMTSCLECDISSICLKCDTGTFLNTSTLCQTCSSAIVGCSTCLSSTVCTSCDINNILVGSGCQICATFIPNCLNCTKIGVSVHCVICAVGYYIDPITFTCKPCNTSVSNCKYCLSEFDCTDCEWLYYLDSPTLCPVCSVALNYCLNCTNNGNTCYQCIDDHSLLDNGKCYLCDNWISDCVRCSDQQHCLQCEVKYHLITDVILGNIGCKLCELSMEGCSTCNSAVFCTSVVSDFYSIYSSNNTVAKCNVMMPYCTRCTSQSICIVCQVGYFLQNNKCIECISVIDYCLQCSNRSICLVCESDFQPYNPAGNCTCKQGWYVPNACTTTYGCISAQKFIVQSVCLLCDSDQHFVYDPIDHTCFCDIGYLPTNGSCFQTCGDGTHFGMECDDGNILNLDGCSSSCKVEKSYVCKGSNYQVSKCFINLEPQIKYLYTIRTDGQNKGIHYFSIEPQSYFYDRVNFVQIFSLQDSRVVILSSRHDRGHIQIQFAFNQSLDNQQFIAKWNLSKVFNSNKTRSTGFSTAPMSPPLNILKYRQFFQIAYVIGEVLSYLLLALLIVGMFFHKMIAIQLVIVYQIIYVSGLLNVQNISIYRVLKSLRPAFGISNIIQGSRIQLIYPQILRFWSIGKSLMLNFNISLLVYGFIFLVFIGLIVYLFRCKLLLRNYSQLAVKLQKKFSKKSKVKLDKLLGQIEEQKFKLKDNIFHANKRSQFIYQRIFYSISIFMLFPTIIAYAVGLIGSIKGQPILLTTVSNILFQIIFFIELWLFCYQTRKTFSKYKELQMKLPFRSVMDGLKRSQYNIYTGLFLIFSLFYVVMSIIGLQISPKIGILSLLIGVIVYIIYVQVYQPYLENYHNKILILNNSILLFYSIVLLIDFSFKISQLVLLILILIVFVSGYIAVILSLYRMFLENKQINKHKSQELKAPQKRNIKDSLKINQYIYRQDQNNELPPDLKIKRQLYFYRGRQIDVGLGKNNILAIQQVVDSQTQLMKIKRRLRKEVKYMQLQEGEDLFVYNEQVGR